jgi:tetratricopeptide (TPR) repeat protein
MTRVALVKDAPLAGNRTRLTRIREKIRQQWLGTGIKPDGQPWLDQAWRALSRGDYQVAAYAAARSMEDGATVQSALIRARAAAGLGRFEDAVIEAQRAVRLAPDEPDPHLTLAGIFADLGNVPAALRSYRAAERLTPDATVPCVGRALAFAQSGETDRAERLLEAMYAADPDRWPIRDCLALVLVDAAERVPRVCLGERYVITAPSEIAAMRAKLTRASTVAVDDELRTCVGEVRAYVEACTRRDWSRPRLFPVPRWKLNRLACDREERDGRR